MTSISDLAPEQREEITARLKRIEGQTRGIQKMVEEGRDCAEILNQMAAARAAMNALSTELLEAFALRCMQHPEEFSSHQAALETAVRAIIRSGR